MPLDSLAFHKMSEAIPEAETIDHAVKIARVAGFAVELIADNPVFVLQRGSDIVATLDNERTKIGIGRQEDINLAMKLAQNRPKSPIDRGAYLLIKKPRKTMRWLNRPFYEGR